MKKLIKKIIPPLFLDLYRRVIHYQYGWHGNYKDWEDAKRQCSGYEDPQILEKVKESALKVKKGEAIYERDGVIFDEIQYSWPLLTGLMFAAAKNNGKLIVLDFGGSLGSSYFQNKKFLDQMKEVRWCVVEQEHYVDVAKKHFEDERLKFYYDVNECVEKEKPNILLLSSVLQYIEKPYEVLSDLLRYDFHFLILDRTPFINQGKDILKIQRVPPWIYKASYPSWIFSYENMITLLKKKYYIFATFNSIDGKWEDIEFKGFIGIRND